MIFVQSFRRKISDHGRPCQMCEIRDPSPTGLEHAGNPKFRVSPDILSISEKLLVNDGVRYRHI